MRGVLAKIHLIKLASGERSALEDIRDHSSHQSGFPPNHLSRIRRHDSGIGLHLRGLRGLRGLVLSSAPVVSLFLKKNLKELRKQPPQPPQVKPFIFSQGSHYRFSNPPKKPHPHRWSPPLPPAPPSRTTDSRTPSSEPRLMIGLYRFVRADKGYGVRESRNPQIVFTLSVHTKHPLKRRNP